jgi:hypothetical protein
MSFFYGDLQIETTRVDIGLARYSLVEDGAVGAIYQK